MHLILASHAHSSPASRRAPYARSVCAPCLARLRQFGVAQFAAQPCERLRLLSVVGARHIAMLVGFPHAVRCPTPPAPPDRPRTRVFVSDIDSYLGRALLFQFASKRGVDVVGTVRTVEVVPPKVVTAMEVSAGPAAGPSSHARLAAPSHHLCRRWHLAARVGRTGVAVAPCLGRLVRPCPATVADVCLAWLGPWQVGSEGVSELARSADLVIVNIAEPNGDTRVVLDGACRRTRGASAFHTVLESFPALAAIAISDGGRVCSLSLFRFAYS
jgi:hypothetical protein